MPPSPLERPWTLEYSAPSASLYKKKFKQLMKNNSSTQSTPLKQLAMNQCIGEIIQRGSRRAPFTVSFFKYVWELQIRSEAMINVYIFHVNNHCVNLNTWKSCENFNIYLKNRFPFKKGEKATALLTHDFLFIVEIIWIHEICTKKILTLNSNWTIFYLFWPIEDVSLWHMGKCHKHFLIFRCFLVTWISSFQMP